jgi:hypothetical protein
MPNLFRLIPADLFQPLAAPGAGVYVEILLALLAETQRHHEPLSRERALNVLYPILNDPQRLALTADAVESADEPIGAGDQVQARASSILRYLERRGWLRGETQSDFTHTYILPDYAFRLLRVLNEIAVDEPPPLAGLVYTIHSVLRETARDGNADFGIPEAHRHAEHLVNGLKELQHNIGQHINRVLQRLTADEVLAQFFAEYQSEIVDRAYHQLRTTDHVARYRPAVLEALDRLANAETLETAARRQYERHEAPSVEAAAVRLREQLTAMRDDFESLDRRLEAIDTRHSQFVHSAVRAVELHLAAQSTTSGQLSAILERLLADTTGAVLEEVTPSLNLYRLELPAPESLAPPTRAAQLFEPDATRAAELSDEDKEAAIAETLRQLDRAVSRDKIQRFARRLLHDRPHLRAAEIHLHSPDDLPLLIYLRAYGDGALGYRVEPTDDWIESDGFAFHDFRITRLESEA